MLSSPSRWLDGAGDGGIIVVSGVAEVLKQRGRTVVSDTSAGSDWRNGLILSDGPSLSLLFRRGAFSGALDKPEGATLAGSGIINVFVDCLGIVFGDTLD